MDATDDGVGDFAGLAQQLDYIAELGVTAIWLLPFYPSPLRDDGYDIADYTQVHPDYGTLRDFRVFVREAHRRGLRVITELVVNHTSDQHPWFVESRCDRSSPRRDWYVWSDTDQKYTDARIIFTDTESSNWTWDQESEQYYWHRFFSHQPDLNYDNPQRHPRDPASDALLARPRRRWAAARRGAVPRRARGHERREPARDARRSCVGSASRWTSGTPGACCWPRRTNGRPTCCPTSARRTSPSATWPSTSRSCRASGSRCAARTATRSSRSWTRRPRSPTEAQWALFLRNHDELTLEMVTDEERDFMYTEYARDARMRINVGIRRRLAPLVDNSRRRLELLNSLLFSMRGTPIIYYGDEIGMGDNVYLGDRNGVRTPMQWTGDRNAGFSRADVHALYAPLVADPVYGYQAVNVEAQERVPGSLLNWMKRLIRVRRTHPVFGRGTLEFLPPGEPSRPRLPARARGRHDPVRREPVALRAVRRARPVALRRARAGRAHRPRPLPAHRRASVPAHPGPARLLLVRADRWLSRRPRSGSRRRTTSRPGPASAASRSAATYPGIVPRRPRRVDRRGASPCGRRGSPSASPTASGGRGSSSGMAP